MTRLLHDPAGLTDEMIQGFVAANSRYVQRVAGGVVRSTISPEGQVAVAVAVVLGGGVSHGAAMGDLFASPSTQQVRSVDRDASAVIYGGSAGSGLFTALGGAVDGLFLGRFAHNPAALAFVLDEAAELARSTARA